MRVAFLTHYYPPEVGAPQARIAALVAGLRERGAAVAVHTCPPHYPSGRIEPPYSNAPFRVEQRDGVRVVRSAVYPAPNRGVARRLANHTSFALSALATARLTGPADVVVVESPPLFTAAAGVAYARLKRAPMVLNVADLWPASAVELGMLTSPAAIRAATALERACYRGAAAIAAPTRGIVDALDALPAARGRVEQMPPAVDLERFEAAAPRAGEPPLRVLYAGTVGLAQGLGTLLEAARLAGPELVEVTIAGGGAQEPELREAARRDGLAHVRLAGTVPHADVPRLYAGVDAAVVLLRDRPIFEGALPTKLLEAMAAGRPVVLAARGEAARLVEEAGAGIVVAPEDPRALAQALRDLAADPERRRALGAAGRRCAEQRFSRARSLERWAALLERVAAVSRTGRGPSRAA